MTMNEQTREIARRYMLPERPFLHGMASAFDMFGVLNEGKRELLLANLQEEFRAGLTTDIMSPLCHGKDIGESLVFGDKGI